MSIERSLDRLDEKLSSLLRNMGLLTTLLFGFITIFFNYSTINNITKTTILTIIGLLIGLFITNILYSLYLYIHESPKIDDYIKNLSRYYEFYNYIDSVYENIQNKCSEIETNYILYYENVDFKNNEFDIKSINKFLDYLIEKLDLKLDENENFSISFQNLTVFINDLYSIIEIEKNINNLIYTSVLALKNSTSFDNYYGFYIKHHTLLELLNAFAKNLSLFQDLKNFKDYNRNGLFHYRPTIIVRHMLYVIFNVAYSTYMEYHLEENNVKKNFEKKIRTAYIFFGIAILASSAFAFVAIFYLYSIGWPPFQ